LDWLEGCVIIGSQGGEFWEEELEKFLVETSNLFFKKPSLWGLDHYNALLPIVIHLRLRNWVKLLKGKNTAAGSTSRDRKWDIDSAMNQSMVTSTCDDIRWFRVGTHREGEGQRRRGGGNYIVKSAWGTTREVGWPESTMRWAV
jgi:hypothetical protein